MAHPPPVRTAAAPLTDEERVAAEVVATKTAALTIERHVDMWIRGQGRDLPEKPEIPIGEHGSVAPEVLAELVSSYRAAGWTKALVSPWEPLDDLVVAFDATRFRASGQGWVEQPELAEKRGPDWALNLKLDARGVVLYLDR